MRMYLMVFTLLLNRVFFFIFCLIGTERHDSERVHFPIVTNHPREVKPAGPSKLIHERKHEHDRPFLEVIFYRGRNASLSKTSPRFRRECEVACVINFSEFFSLF